MKLRIRDNSLRLRLSRSEVEAIRDVGLLRSAVQFPSGARFEYVLESSPASVAPTAEYADNVVLVKLPESAVHRWADSDEVAIASDEAVGNNGVLTLLIEKDFVCLSPRDDEDESDLFVHPDVGKRRC